MTRGFSTKVKKCIRNCMDKGKMPKDDRQQGYKLMGCVKKCRKPRLSRKKRGKRKR